MRLKWPESELRVEAARLRALDAPSRTRAIQEHLASLPWNVMYLVRHVQLEKSDYRVVLDHAIDTANIHSMRLWLEALIPRMGIQRIITRLKERAKDRPRSVYYAAWNLKCPLMIRIPDLGHGWEAALDELCGMVAEQWAEMDARERAARASRGGSKATG